MTNDDGDTRGLSRRILNPAFWKALGAIVTIGISVAAAYFSYQVSVKPPATVVANPPQITIDGLKLNTTPEFVCGPEADSVATAGWGPDRPMMSTKALFTFQWPAFNVLYDNPNYGDERNFVLARDITDAAALGPWTDRVEMIRGHKYLARLYVHNEGQPIAPSDATGVKATFNLPTCTGRSIPVNGFVSSTIAYPLKIWDGFVAYSNDHFNLAFIEGTGVLHSNPHATGLKIPGTDFLTSKAQLLGPNADGGIKDGYGDSFYFSFEFRPQFAG